MNWSEYLPLSEKTLSTQFNCQDEFHQKLLHAVIGSLTEVEEILDNYSDGELVTDINTQGSLGEEIADAAWYVSILFRELDIKNVNFQFSDTDEEKPFNILLSFLKVSLKFLDLLKKKIYYGKEINKETMIDFSVKMYLQLRLYSHSNGANFEEILDKNIAKLKARYGDKFSSEKAINRDLEVEKTILENKN
jgi:NTP pyrophosphatase (non-canonical NTP hydrolase)